MSTSPAPELSTAAAPPPASPVSQVWLEGSVDFGVSKIDVWMRFNGPGAPQSLDQMISVKLGRTNVVSQTMGFDIDDKFVWGDNAANARAENRLSPENVIPHLKLCFCKNHKSSEITARAESQLSRFGVTGQEVLVLVLKDIIAIMKKQADSRRHLWRSVDDDTAIDDMPIHLFLTIPEMWNAVATRRIADAAKLAGAHRVQLLRESRCVAAYFMHNAVTLGKLSFQAGDGLVVIDSGSGTTDMTCYEMPSPETAGAQIELRRTSDAVGGLCGSQFINELFLKWLKLHADASPIGFDDHVRSLGYAGAPHTGFHLAANEAFDKAKHVFTPTLATVNTDMSVFIMGDSSSATATEWSWNVRVPSAAMKGFFDEVIETNFGLLAAAITPTATWTAKFIVATGGLLDSQYVRNEMKRRVQQVRPDIRIFDSDDVLEPGQQGVSRGAFLRYKEIDVNAASGTGYFGLARDEEFDGARHPDGVIKAGTEIPTEQGARAGARKRWQSKAIVNRKIVIRSEFTGADEVLARWDPILSADGSNGSEALHRIWQMRIIKVRNRDDLEFQIYWTGSKGIVQGSPIFVGAPDNGILRDEVEEWGGPIRIPCPDFMALGFEVNSTPPPSSDVYQPLFLVEVRERGANAAIKIKLVLSDWRNLFDENGRPDPKKLKEGSIPDGMELLTIYEEELVEEDFNPFPRN